MEAALRINPQPVLRRCRCSGVEKAESEYRLDGRTKDGYAYKCKECELKGKRKPKATTLADGTKIIGLDAYPPIQLMKELARRGYDGTLTIVERKTVRLKDLL